jgi:hypothetical protein
MYLGLCRRLVIAEHLNNIGVIHEPPFLFDCASGVDVSVAENGATHVRWCNQPLFDFQAPMHAYPRLKSCANAT